MAAVAVRFIGGAAAPAEENRSFIFNDPSPGADHAKMTGDLQRSSSEYLKACLVVFHGQVVSSVKPIFRCRPSQ